MLNLFLIRHAKSSWDNPGLRDFDRPLNERGLREAPLMAQILEKQGLIPDLLVSSPAKRAWSTAQFFAAQFKMSDENLVKNQDIYEAYPQVILRLIAELPAAARTVFLFGHNPTFTDVANLFSEEYIENVPTCGIVWIASEADRWSDVFEGNSAVKQCFFPKETL